MKTDQAELPKANSRSSTLEQKKNSGLLMFVDTNIFLQAYAHPDVRVPLLEELMSISERIICSEQLAMEFMKNRQQKIRESLKSLKLELPTPPGFFAGSSTLSDWEDHKQKTKAKFEQLKTSLNDAIEDPVKNDRVFAVVQNLVQKSSLYGLLSRRTFGRRFYNALRSAGNSATLLVRPATPPSETLCIGSGLSSVE